jgi:hypothetical protein
MVDPTYAQPSVDNVDGKSSVCMPKFEIWSYPIVR